jgi:Lar family restriction alleviation protein
MTTENSQPVASVHPIVLLPCPFCGGKGEMVRTGTSRRSCQVSCTNCNCHHESSDKYEHSGSSWNTRIDYQDAESYRELMKSLGSMPTKHPPIWDSRNIGQ